MIGCGKISELEMLKYLDGKRSGPFSCAVEEHLMECEMCLREMVELNRIQAETAAEEKPGLKLPNFITVFSSLKKGRGITRAVVSAVSAKWEILAETRSGEENARPKSGERAVSFVMDSEPVTVRIIPGPGAAFRISLGGDRVKGEVVELGKKGGSLPLFSRKADSNMVTINGVEFGEYEMKFRNSSIRINLRPEDAETEE